MDQKSGIVEKTLLVDLLEIPGWQGGVEAYVCPLGTDSCTRYIGLIHNTSGFGHPSIHPFIHHPSFSSHCRGPKGGWLEIVIGTGGVHQSTNIHQVSGHSAPYLPDYLRHNEHYCSSSQRGVSSRVNSPMCKSVTQRGDMGQEKVSRTCTTLAVDEPTVQDSICVHMVY